MTERSFYFALLGAWVVLALAAFVALLVVSAPYGRHRREGWGPSLPARMGWLLMELPAVLTVAALWAVSERRPEVVPLAFLLMWQAHYVYRALVYPFTTRGGKPMPLSVAAMAAAFNVVNGYLNARWLFALGPERGAGWLVDPRFVGGLALFAAGLALHVRSDARLARLRGPGETRYAVPRGGAFRFVSCPNYLGEVVEWTGWALATWSPAGAAFALWTAANLVPRALAHHRWYRERFPDYPPERRALIPLVL